MVDVIIAPESARQVYTPPLQPPPAPRLDDLDRRIIEAVRDVGPVKTWSLFNWLAQDENLISIRPKSSTNRRVTLTSAQAAVLRWLDLIFLPAFVIVAGVAIWWKRR